MKRRDGLEYVSGLVIVRDRRGRFAWRLDFDATYTVAHEFRVAWRALGWEPRWEPWTTLCVDEETGKTWEEETGEGEWVPDVGGRVGVRMVGDDRVEYVDREDLRPLARADYCGECGQVGCRHDGLDRGDA